MDEIVPGVFVGDAISARSADSKIKRVVNAGQLKNLIHCQLGVSRSCSLMVVYLLVKNICSTVDEAIAYVQKKRSVAFINRRHLYRDVIEDWFSNWIQ